MVWANEVNMIGDNIVNFLLEKNGNMALNIAFLPYCFKMWDCMESVYKNAKDRGVGVGVFPIPYFSLKNGKIDEWHNEHELFEDSVDEEDLYDFNVFFKVAKDLDFVIIHNAYDDGNNLTTVNPLFYTDRLKAMGLKIVFIPYGIPCGGVSNDTMRLTKGALNSDYIFVNGEEERKGFIASWKKVGVDMTSRCFAFGSPKIDALYKQFNMPFEWKRKVYKPITLMCTSIMPFASAPEKKLKLYKKKINELLECGNMVIFRPHPLMEETIKSRCPEHLDEWEKLLDFAEEYAIVDYDHELAESMYFSEYLISDPSSIIEVWKETGKPYEVIE